MSEIEIITPISKEIGRLKSYVKYLWELSKQSQLDRNNCKNTVLEIRKSLTILWNLMQETVLELIRGLGLEKRLLFMIITGKDLETSVKEFFKWPPYESEISTVILMLDSPEYYKDKEVKERISRLAESLETAITTLELKLNLKQGVSRLSEFLTTFPQFTENWAVALCYLASMEIMVKNKLKELGLKVDEGFRENYEKLLEKLKEEGIQVSELEKRLPKIFWEIRNRVVHEGYSPTSDELEMIIKYVEKLLTLLSR